MAINDKTTIITCSNPQKIDKAICQCVASQPIVNPRARSKSTNLRTALTMGTPPHKSGANLRTAVFCDFFLKSNSLQSRAHSKKRSDRDSCLTFWNANRALATVWCTFCWELSQIEARNRGNRNPTLATHGATLPENNTGFRARECFHPFNLHASELLHFPTTWWWCGWHGGNADHDNR